LRELEPERLDGRKTPGLLAVRHLRVLAPARRLRRRTSGVRARGVRGRGAAQDPRRGERRAGAVPVRHPSDRLHGGRACNIQPGDLVAVWGCGPVGQFAIASAYLLGTARVIAIDRFPYRLAMARDRAGAEPLNYEEVDVREAPDEMTGGRGPR